MHVVRVLVTFIPSSTYTTIYTYKIYHTIVVSTLKSTRLTDNGVVNMLHVRPSIDQSIRAERYRTHSSQHRPHTPYGRSHYGVCRSQSQNKVEILTRNLGMTEDDVRKAIHEGHAMKDVIKVGRRGACDDIVEHIRKRWNTSKVVKLHCSGKPSHNMKELANDIEMKTKGIILFRSGGTIILHQPDG